ncbi:MAG TPA: DUF4080 domain-containing protein [Verrucomicrobiota bacterium]|nr:DUF4080 domain-containing protein [Verrucomicrobiota bacterium]HNT15989.1 DUF4080 domain-containing protein [Verrucomicrobiota bacterium]
MPDIILTTLNAKFIHASFGLRYLFANLGELQARTALLEFDINQRLLDVAEVLLAQNPKIIGCGVYVWNATETAKVLTVIKRVRPDILIVLGGPEVSYETDQQDVVRLADYVITGEADLKFAEVCRQLLDAPAAALRPGPDGGNRAGGSSAPLPRIIPAPPPDFAELTLPYEFYTAQDIAHRVLYVEAWRGCPFSCEFCLSSLDIPVRAVDLPRFLGAMQQLLDRGARQFKFVDRTFSLNLKVSRAILEFFLTRHRPGHFYHFEMIPDRLPEGLRGTIAKFPPGAMQFEVGIQTFNPEVAQLISRRQNYAKLEDNLSWLRNHSGVHIHADLIAGLPGEDLASFGAGFDKLIALRPQEIQVGILKRLRGTPIARHDARWQMIYHPQPPYEILQTRLIDFATMQRLRRFAKYWDLVGNSGNFVETAPLLWSGQASPFTAFLNWSDWLFARTRRTDSIALAHLMELLLEHLTTVTGLDAPLVAQSLWRDYQRGGRQNKPGFLAALIPDPPKRGPTARRVGPKRQSRHLETT